MFKNRFVEFEQFVNNRKRIIGDPKIPYEFTPESGLKHDLVWVLVSFDQVKFLATRSSMIGERLAKAVTIQEPEKKVIFPIHWFQEQYYRSQEKVELGKGVVSSSYRTIFVEFDKSNAQYPFLDHMESYMLKLHLENGLPGIEGDRRITEDVAMKCLRKSDHLALLKQKGYFPDFFDFMPEEFSIIYENRGVIFRRIVDHDVIPAFSLFSRNINRRNDEIVAIQIFKTAKKANPGAGDQIYLCSSS